MSLRCPVCGSADQETILERARLPVFQNVVYATEAEARAAPSAPFRLSTCRHCGFSWNSLFDENLVRYDESYNNDVVSGVFVAYYRELAARLIARFGLTSGVVYDVGCGSGGFLRELCALAPGITGVGIDPACQPLEEGNFKLIRGVFTPELFAGEVKLVLLRHVLEHIPDPVGFATGLAAAIPAGAPLFVEVPDLDWIYRARAFWDFCYEHCNYFTAASLKAALAGGGLAVGEQAYAFGGHYQWALCARGAGAAAAFEGGEAAVAAGPDYARAEAAALGRLNQRAAQHGGLVLWGMATKGVVLSNMITPGSLRGGVDMNPAKQGRFAAGSGLPIHAPDWLKGSEAGLAILVMNPNYTDEIRAKAAAMGLKQTVLDA